VSDEFYDLLIRIVALLNDGNGTNMKNLRILAHSETAMLVAIVSVQETRSDKFRYQSKPGGPTIYVENLKLEKVYFCHTSPLVEYHVACHGLPPSKVTLAKKLWLERNMDIVERAESGNTIVIATTPITRSFFVKGRNVTKSSDGIEIVVRENGKEFMLWQPAPETVQRWRTDVPSFPPLDLVDEMHRVWRQSEKRN
jgi:hypothetical protein